MYCLSSRAARSSQCGRMCMGCLICCEGRRGPVFNGPVTHGTMTVTAKGRAPERLPGTNCCDSRPGHPQSRSRPLPSHPTAWVICAAACCKQTAGGNAGDCGQTLSAVADQQRAQHSTHTAPRRCVCQSPFEGSSCCRCHPKNNAITAAACCAVLCRPPASVSAAATQFTTSAVMVLLFHIHPQRC